MVYILLFFLPPEVVRGANFHGRVVFFVFFRMYLAPALEVKKRLFIDCLCFMTVNRFMKHPMALRHWPKPNILTLALISAPTLLPQPSQMTRVEMRSDMRAKRVHYNRLCKTMPF